MGQEHYHVKATKQAEMQMHDIAQYIAVELQNVDDAIKLLDAFQQVMDSLCEMPERFALVEEKTWKRQGIHRVVINNFLMYFWIEEDALLVHVTAVVYAKRDQKRVLKKCQRPGKIK